jgi:ribonuclease P protein component
VSPERLTGRSAFAALLSDGQRVRAGALHASVLVTGNAPRVGYAIPKALGNAVVRNLLRRRLRELVRPLASGLPPADILIRPRSSATQFDSNGLAPYVRRLVQAIQEQVVVPSAPSLNPTALTSADSMPS